MSVMLSVMALSGCNDNKHNNDTKSHIQKPSRSVQAEQLIGQIQMSVAAIEASLNDSAKVHIDNAITLTLALKESAPEVTSEQTVKLGKFSYKTEMPSKDYLIPIAENIYTLDNYVQQQSDTESTSRMNADVEILYSSFVLNLDSTEQALNKANTALSNGDNKLAKKVLSGVFTNNLLDQFKLSDPLLEVVDNLELVRLLVNDRRFYAAGTSLSNIQELLEESFEIKPQPFMRSLMDRAKSLKENVERENSALLPQINREIAFLNRDIKEYLQRKNIALVD